MTRVPQGSVDAPVTVFRGLRAGTQMRPARRPNARQAVPHTLAERSVDRGAPRQPGGASSAPTA
jgi:hypothetical protein